MLKIDKDEIEIISGEDPSVIINEVCSLIFSVYRFFQINFSYMEVNLEDFIEIISKTVNESCFEIFSETNFRTRKEV